MVLVYMWYCVHVIHAMLWECNTNMYVHYLVVVLGHVYLLCCTLCSTCIMLCCMPGVGKVLCDVVHCVWIHVL